MVVENTFTQAPSQLGSVSACRRVGEGAKYAKDAKIVEEISKGNVLILWHPAFAKCFLGGTGAVDILVWDSTRTKSPSHLPFSRV
jgi:hypothetical protein